MFIQGLYRGTKSRGVSLKLVILESGAKARTIKKYLGRGWMVDACNGHVQDLPSNGKTKDSSKAMWASKPGELPNPPWSWTDKAEQVMSKIANKARKSGVQEVFIATDPDREGEFIAWRLSEILSSFGAVHRVSFNEITKEAVTAAISNPRELDMSLVDAAIVRRLMDRLVGFRCSKFCRSWKLRSMGRVQTPTLGYIVDRELDREAHIPKEFHTVSVVTNAIDAKVRFHESDDPQAWMDNDGKHHPERTSDSAKADNAYQAMKYGGILVLDAVKESTVNRKPQPPFTTDTMLQNASSSLGWSISKTSAVASTLYQSGHITYIRTDSTRTNDNARAEVRNHIESTYGTEFIGEGVGESNKKNQGNIQDAHEAIRPTKPSSTEAGSDHDEKMLYKLIWSRFAASQMSNSIRERRSLTFSCEGMDEKIHATSSWRTHSGWEEVFDWNRSEVSTEPPDIGFEIGNNWQMDQEPELTVDFTKPIRRFSESSIIQQMKKDGIGRPSTYVSTVTKLVDRGYIDRDGSSLIPTEDGRTLWLVVAPHYNQTEVYGDGLFTYNFTSNMEGNLDHIESGDVVASEKWDEFVDVFRGMHNIALEKRREKPTIRQTQYLESILGRMPDDERTEIIGGKKVSDLTGSEVREIIDGMSESMQASIPPSEKQTATIIRLLDKLNLDTDEALKEMGLSDLDDLTGGRDGTASELIGKLIDLDRLSPATERQVSTIISMSDSLEMPIENAMEIARCESIDTITKSEASSLISSLKKMINSNRKRKR
tara:strand:+ start:986 stop:3292 length:2307 start_codon:yes stop_codon:yes gene_type:complete